MNFHNILSKIDQYDKPVTQLKNQLKQVFSKDLIVLKPKQKT